MKSTKNKTILLITIYLFMPSINASTDLLGEWCENGGPYLCYPPIDNKKPEYICTDSTRITKATDDHIVFETTQTVHYYSDGFKNGKTSTARIRNIFKRNPENSPDQYQATEQGDNGRVLRELKVRENHIQMSFRRESLSSENPAIIGKINYQRCSDDEKKKSFYTALVDCGGSGDYIAGVPAVVNNPLIWDLGEKSSLDKSRCQVAARCWGGGWVAFAISEQDADDDKEAFGAACGSQDRQEAKQQAINSCRESGGTNCLANVVSGFDDGSNDLDDTTHKGIKVESCSFGNCKSVSVR